MKSSEKILTASAFAALLGSGMASQAFAHTAAAPADAGPDPFDNPDFALQNAMNFFDSLADLSRDGHAALTYDSLADIIHHAPLNPEQQSFILNMHHDIFAEQYQSGDVLSTEEIALFNEHVQLYLDWTARGFDDIHYSAAPEKADTSATEKKKTRAPEPRADVGFTLAQGDICGLNKTLQSDDLQQRLSEMKAHVSSVPAAQKALKDIEDNKAELFFSPLKDAGGMYNAGGGSAYLRLSTALAPHHYLDVLIHEERHADQFDYKNIHSQIDQMRVSPGDYVWLNRVLEADAQTEAVYQQLIIQLAGDDSCMNYNKIYSSDGPMFKAAQEQYLKDPTSLNDGRVKRAAFDAWFNIPEVKDNFYDRKAVDYGSWWEGHDRALAKKDIGKSVLPREVVESIGIAADEKLNYLTLEGYPPIDDPYYKENYTPENQKMLDRMTNNWPDQYPQKPVQPPKLTKAVKNN